MTAFDCAHCANPAHTTDTGVTHHDDPDSPTGIDHDLDADHTPYPPADDKRTHLGMTASDLLDHLRDPASGHAFTPADEHDLWANMSASGDYLDLLAAYHNDEHQQGADLPHGHDEHLHTFDGADVCANCGIVRNQCPGVPCTDPDDEGETESQCANCGRDITDLGIDSDGSRRCDDTDPAHRFHAPDGAPLMAVVKHPN